MVLPGQFDVSRITIVTKIFFPGILPSSNLFCRNKLNLSFYLKTQVWKKWQQNFLCTLYADLLLPNLKDATWLIHSTQSINNACSYLWNCVLSESKCPHPCREMNRSLSRATEIRIMRLLSYSALIKLDLVSSQKERRNSCLCRRSRRGRKRLPNSFGASMCAHSIRFNLYTIHWLIRFE